MLERKQDPEALIPFREINLKWQAQQFYHSKEQGEFL